MLESPAHQIRFELVFDVARQLPLLGCPPIPEGRIVLGNEPVEQCRFRPVPRVPRAVR